jgi:hypothetical protein
LTDEGEGEVILISSFLETETFLGDGDSSGLENSAFRAVETDTGLALPGLCGLFLVLEFKFKSF